MAMNKSDATEMEKEIGSQIQLIIGRVPKKNHDGLTNIANTVSASQDEEVWVVLQYYRDRKHLDEVRAKCGNDENMGRLYKQSLDLLTPGSCFIFGEFDRLSV